MEKGDRIQLLSMGGDDPCPIPSGATGTVTRTHDFGDGSTQVSVEWDAPNETRSLSLVCPPDRARVIAHAEVA